MRFIGRGNKNQQFALTDDIEMSLLKGFCFLRRAFRGGSCRLEVASDPELTFSERWYHA